jgi:hypothetical protein
LIRQYLFCYLSHLKACFLQLFGDFVVCIFHSSVSIEDPPHNFWATPTFLFLNGFSAFSFQFYFSHIAVWKMKKKNFLRGNRTFLIQIVAIRIFKIYRFQLRFDPLFLKIKSGSWKQAERKQSGCVRPKWPKSTPETVRENQWTVR